MAIARITLTENVSSISGRLRRVVGRLSSRLSDYRSFRRTYDELNSLSDRDLADLGIARTEIGRIAHQAVGKCSGRRS